MFSPKGQDLERGWPGLIEGDTVIQLAAQTLQSFFSGGGAARDHAEYPLAEVELRPPVLHPPSVRDFYAFEQHVKTAARGARGREVPKEWYEIPVFYFSNPAAIYGPEAEVPYPEGTEELDYELEVAAVIGAEGEIGGFTVLNDWSARDLQRAEMRSGSGRRRGRTSRRASGRSSSRRTSSTAARRRWSRGSTARSARAGTCATCFHSWDAIVAQAARNTVLRPGDVLGSGTRRHGLHPRARRRPLAAAAATSVELEVEGIGVLRNTVADARRRRRSRDQRGRRGLRARLRRRRGDALRAVPARAHARLEPRHRADLPARLSEADGCGSRRSRSQAGARSRPTAARRCSS